jgi:hypothetical protein
MPPFGRFAMPLACIVLAACTLAASAHAEHWTVSGGTGVGPPYQMSSETAYSQVFDFSWHVTADVTRRLDDHWAVRATAGDLHSSVPWPLLTFEVQATERRIVDFAPIGAGLRFLAAPRGHGTVQAYAEALPALYVSRWRVQKSWAWDFGDPRASGPSSDVRVTRLLAGVMAGAGFQWRAGAHLRPELALRYHLTAGPGYIDSWGASPRGLRQFVVAAGLGWAL